MSYQHSTLGKRLTGANSGQPLDEKGKDPTATQNTGGHLSLSRYERLLFRVPTTGTQLMKDSPSKF